MRQEQELQQSQQLLDAAILQSGQHALMTSVTIGIASQILTELRQEYKMIHDAVPVGHLHGLQARLARAGVLRMASKGYFEMDVEEGGIDKKKFDDMKGQIQEEFWGWWKKQNENVRQFAKFPHEDLSQEQHSNDLLRDSLNHIDGMFHIDHHRREIFEQVRHAIFTEITRDTIHHVLPAIEKSYDRALLKEDTIELLRKNDAASNQAFRDRTKNGIFVFGFHEKTESGASVAEQMEHDFTTPRKTGEPVYRGWYLQDADSDDIHSFLTLWEPPPGSSKKYERMLTRYLHKGVTGGCMKYTRKPDKEQILPYVGKTVMIDTIRGEKTFAAGRLIAKALQDVYSRNKDLELLMGYRLHELFFSPCFDAFREPVRFSANVSSAHFFEGRGCIEFAYDYSPKGPSSMRTLSDGSSLFLNPEWIAFLGKYADVMKASWKIWQSVQKTFGDISDDHYDKNLSNM